MILTRRQGPEDTLNHTDDYGPCPDCLGWFKLSVATRHQKNCVGKVPEDAKKSKGVMLTESAFLSGRVNTKASRAMITEVFPMMKIDEVSKTAQSDDLIISLGNLWLQRNVGNPLMRKYYTSSSMRLMSRMLLHLWKLDPNKSGDRKDLWYYLKPEFFPLVVRAALLCSAQDMDEGLTTPSNAIKLGFDLSRVCSAKLAESLMKEDESSKTEAKHFLKLKEISWGVQVTKLARVTLAERQLNKTVKLPQPSK